MFGGKTNLVLILVLISLISTLASPDQIEEKIINFSDSNLISYVEKDFNDSTILKSDYANHSSPFHINLPKDVSILNASFLMTKVDLASTNYELNYDYFTASLKNNTDELIVGGSQGYIVVLNKTDGSTIYEVPNSRKSYIQDSAVSPDGSTALFVNLDGTFIFYNTNSRTISNTYTIPSGRVTAVDYSTNGSFAIGTGDGDSDIYYINHSNQEVITLNRPSNINRDFDINPVNNQEILFTNYGSNTHLYNVSCMLEENNVTICSRKLSVPADFSSLEWSPNGEEALFGAWSGDVYIYNKTSDSFTELNSGVSTTLANIKYTEDGSNALITGVGGVLLVYNESCNPNLCLIETDYTGILQDLVIEDNTAYLVGSGKTFFTYDFDEVEKFNEGYSGIFEGVDSRPGSSESLVVGAEGQAYIYNQTSKEIEYLETGITNSFYDVAFNWNGTEALIVGSSGTFVKFYPENRTFVNLTINATTTLHKVSYKNGTNNAMISGGSGNSLLVYNETCNGADSLPCKVDLNNGAEYPSGFPIYAFSYSPSGDQGLFGTWHRNRVFNDSDKVLGNASRTGLQVYDIAWKPDGTEALFVGYLNGAAGCAAGGAVGVYYSENSSIDEVSESQSCSTYYGVSYSPDGSEALVVGEKGTTLKYNSTDHTFSELESGTEGTLTEVTYRKDGISTEALIVVGDNKQVLFYDGKKILTNPEVKLDEENIWQHSGEFLNSSARINFTSILQNYLDDCNEDSDGTCNIPFWVNSSTETSLMQLSSINITYSYNASKLFTISNLSWNSSSNLILGENGSAFRNLSSTNIESPVPISIKGFYLDFNESNCKVSNVSYVPVGNPAYCPSSIFVNSESSWNTKIVEIIHKHSEINESEFLEKESDLFIKSINSSGFLPNASPDNNNLINNITLVVNLNESIIKERIFINITNSSNSYKLIVESSDDCDTSTPNWASLNLDLETWRVCGKDTNANDKIDYIKVLIPFFSGKEILIGGFNTSSLPIFSNPINTSDTFRNFDFFRANITISSPIPDSYLFSSNTTGYWSNDSSQSFSSDINASTLKVIIPTRNETVCWQYYANTSDGFYSSSSTYCFKVQNTPPEFEEVLTNQSISSAENLSFQINCTDVDSDANFYYDNSSLFDINTSSGLIFDSPDSSESGNHSILITCGDSFDNSTTSFNYEIRNASAPDFDNSDTSSANFRKYDLFNASIEISAPELSSYIFSTNNSGVWENDSAISLSGKVQTILVSKNISLSRGETDCWKVFANNSEGVLSSSSDVCFKIRNTPPSASNIPNKTAKNNQNIEVNLSDYFTDIDETDDLIFNVSFGDGISEVVINQTTRTAIIIPDDSFSGEIEVNFTASDNETTVESPYTIALSEPTSSGSSSGGGGGGGGSDDEVPTLSIPECSEDWRCGDWSECTNGKQSRVCTEMNDCGSIINEPTSQRSCEPEEPEEESSNSEESGPVVDQGYSLTAYSCNEEDSIDLEITRTVELYEENGNFETVVTVSVENKGSKAAENVELNVPIPKEFLDESLFFSDNPSRIDNEGAVFFVNVKEKENLNVTVKIPGNATNLDSPSIEKEAQTAIIGLSILDPGSLSMNSYTCPLIPVQESLALGIIFLLISGIVLFLFQINKRFSLSHRQIMTTSGMVVLPLLFSFYPFNACLLLYFLIIEYAAIALILVILKGVKRL